jgi:hypothetical protein
MAAALGWYPDPSESGRQRYFDGARWTDNYYYATTSAPMYSAPPADATLEHPRPAGWYPDLTGRRAVAIGTASSGPTTTPKSRSGRRR